MLSVYNKVHDDGMVHVAFNATGQPFGAQVTCETFRTICHHIMVESPWWKNSIWNFVPFVGNKIKALMMKLRIEREVELQEERIVRLKTEAELMGGTMLTATMKAYDDLMHEVMADHYEGLKSTSNPLISKS